jgi:hypothetical protein
MRGLITIDSEHSLQFVEALWNEIAESMGQDLQLSLSSTPRFAARTLPMSIGDNSYCKAEKIYVY